MFSYKFSIRITYIIDNHCNLYVKEFYFTTRPHNCTTTWSYDYMTTRLPDHMTTSPHDAM